MKLSEYLGGQNMPQVGGLKLSDYLASLEQQTPDMGPLPEQAGPPRPQPRVQPGTLLQEAIPTGIRVASGFVPLPGAGAVGALGAQGAEMLQGRRRVGDIDWKNVGAEELTNLVTLPLGPARGVIRGAAQGAGIGLASTAIRTGIEEGRLPDATEALSGTVLGSVLGGGLGKLTEALQNRATREQLRRELSEVLGYEVKGDWQTLLDAKADVDKAARLAKIPVEEMQDPRQALAEGITQAVTRPPPELPAVPSQQLAGAPDAPLTHRAMVDAAQQQRTGELARGAQWEAAAARNVAQERTGTLLEQAQRTQIPVSTAAPETATSSLLRQAQASQTTGTMSLSRFLAEEKGQIVLPGGNPFKRMSFQELSQQMRDASIAGDDALYGKLRQELASRIGAKTPYPIKKTRGAIPIQRTDVEGIVDHVLIKGVDDGPVPERVGTFNISTLFDGVESKDDLARLTGTILKEIQPEIDMARRGHVPRDVTIHQAELLAGKVDNPVDMLLQRKLGQGHSPMELAMFKSVVERSLLGTLKNLQVMQMQGAPGELARAKEAAVRQMIETTTLMQQFAGAKAEQGRGLDILNRQRSGIISLDNAIREQFKNVRGMDDALDKLMTIFDQNPLGVMDAVEGMRGKSAWNKGMSWFIQSLLSSPITHIKNIFGGNFVKQFISTGEEAIAGGIDAARVGAAKALGIPAERRRFVREAGADLYGQWAGQRDGLRAAWAILRNKAQLAGAQTHDIGNHEGNIPFSPGAFLDAGDAYAAGVNTMGALHARATREGLRRGLSVQDGELQTFVDTAVREKPRWLLTEAQKVAEERTWRQNTPLTLAISNLKRTSAGYLLDPAMPFHRTPINLQTDAYEHSPLKLLAFFRPKQWEEWKQDPGVFADQMAKILVGSATLGFFMNGVKNDWITGNGPTEPGQRSAWLAGGAHQPYSIKMPNGEWHSWNWIEPFASLLRPATDLVEMGTKYAVDWPDFWSKAPAVMANAAMNATYVSGVSDMINAFSDWQQFGSRWVQRLAASAAVPNIVGAVARGMDPYVRKPGSITEAIKAKIPGYSQEVPFFRDYWGRKIMREGTTIGGFNIEALLNPSLHRTVNNDPATREVIRLDQAGFRTSAGPPASYLTPWAGQGKIELGQSDYDHYQETAGDRAHERVTKLLGSYSYQNAPDERKSQLIRREIDAAREWASNQIKRDIRRRGKTE